jgi:hypothetical protein
MYRREYRYTRGGLISLVATGLIPHLPRCWPEGSSITSWPNFDLPTFVWLLSSMVLSSNHREVPHRSGDVISFMTRGMNARQIEGRDGRLIDTYASFIELRLYAVEPFDPAISLLRV